MRKCSHPSKHRAQCAFSETHAKRLGKRRYTKKEEKICAEGFQEKPPEENEFSNRRFSPTFISAADSIPLKRFARPLLVFLTPKEVQALLDAPDVATQAGRRDRLLFQLLYNTVARISEIIHLRVEDVSAHHFQAIQLRGKGRKQRVVPLWKTTRRLLRQWVANNSLKPGATPTQQSVRSRFIAFGGGLPPGAGGQQGGPTMHLASRTNCNTAFI